MSLPAYLFLYDESGVLINGSCSASGREGAIEVMSTQHTMNLSADAHSGMLTGSRMHHPVIINKEIDCASPYLADLLCTGNKISKAILRFYTIIDAGIEVELYTITLEKVIISSISLHHSYIPGSTSQNMMETVSLRYGGITWNYLRGNIIKNDFWGKENRK